MLILIKKYKYDLFFFLIIIFYYLNYFNITSRFFIEGIAVLFSILMLPRFYLYVYFLILLIQFLFFMHIDALIGSTSLSTQLFLFSSLNRAESCAKNKYFSFLILMLFVFIGVISFLDYFPYRSISYRSSGIFGSPSIFAVVASAYIIRYIPSKKNIILLGVSLYFIFLSGSRGGALCLLGYIFSSFFKNFSLKNNIVAIYVLFVVIFFSDFYSVLSSTRGLNYLETSDTLRFNSFEETVFVLTSNIEYLLIGYGKFRVGSLGTYFSANDTLVVESSVISFFLSYGISGVFLLYFFLKSIYTFQKNTKMFIFSICLFLSSLFSVFIDTPSACCLLAIAISSVQRVPINE